MKKETKNLEKIKGCLKTVEDLMKQLNYPEKIIEKEIKPFGNSCHMVLPKKYQNKKASIIIKK